MPDPLDEFSDLMEYMGTRRFLGNAIAGLGFLLLVTCLTTGPLAPEPQIVPILARLGALIGFAGLCVDDPPVTE